MTYCRDESFLGHVHRHPAGMRYRHHANARRHARQGRGRMVLDGGAYASSSHRGRRQRRSLRRRALQGAQRGGRRLRRAHEQPAVRGHARLRRGAGVLRPRVADGQARRRARHGPGRAAAAQRAGDRRRAAHRAGHHRRRAGGRVHPGLRASRPLPPPPDAGRRPDGLPGGAGRTADRPHVRRGVGFAVGFKNLHVLRGLRRRLRRPGPARARADGGRWPPSRRRRRGRPGLRHLAQQIARTVLGVDDVVVAPGGHRGRLGRLQQRPRGRRGCPAARCRRPAPVSAR